MRLGLYLAAALFGVLAPSIAQAQVPPVPSILEEKDETAKRIEQRIALLTEKLDLNESQQANAEECLKAAVDKFKEIRDDATLPDDQKKSFWASSRKAYRNYLRSLLTDEQKDTFDALLLSLAAEKAKDEKVKAIKDAKVADPSQAPDPKDPLLDDLTPVTAP